MAGIGFELKKMFQKKGVFATIKAYGYAGIVCIGPMLLGIFLLLGIQVLARIGGAGKADRELLNAMITYTLLASMVLTNIFALITTRFTADMLYLEEKEKIMPSFYGSTAIMLVMGFLFYGAFLLCAGIPAEYQLLCLVLFELLVVVWTQINYLTAIKDYKGILLAFASAILVSGVAASLLLFLKAPVILAMLLSVCLSYGIMMVWYYVLMIQYFPEGEGSAFYFLQWFDRHFELVWVGLNLSIGLFGHLVIMWNTRIGERISGMFYSAPMYDIAALLAFLSILVTMINFVTSVEVNFYPKYRTYFGLINDGGTLMDIEQAQKEMTATLSQELMFMFCKQFFMTIVFIIGGSILLPHLPIGANGEMLGIYRVLCVGYAFYACGNAILLIQLYFADGKGAWISSSVFMAVSVIATFVMRNGSMKAYGAGFMLGGIAFTACAVILLIRYLEEIIYHVLCNQPITSSEKTGIFTKISRLAEKTPRIK